METRIKESEFKAIEATAYGTSPYDGSPETVVLRNLAAIPSKSRFAGSPDVIVLANESNPNEMKTISLRRGVPSDKKSYDLVTLVAQEDREGIAPNGKAWSLKKGISKKTFAV